MPSQASTLLGKITGWRLNVVIIILTIGLTNLVVALVDWLLLSRIGPDSMKVSTVSGLVIATLIVSAAGSLRARIARSHRRKLEQGIERAKRHLRLAIETSGMLVWELELLTGQMQYDHANLSLLGLATDTKADYISDWMALIHPDDRAPFQRRFQETLIPGAPAFKLDYRLQQATGDWQWVNTQGQVTVRDAQGAPLVAVGGTINIDQRKQTELALQESKERLEAIFNDNPELMLISRLSDGHITEVNEAFIRRSGFSREQAIGNTTLGLGLWVHTQDRQRMTDALSAKGRCDDLETVFYDHSGQVVECALDAVATNVGGVPHIVCTVRDISQRKRAEAERQASETLLRTTLASTDEGILMVGQDGQVLSANQRFIELWHVPEELIATGRDDLMMAHVLGQLSDPDAFVGQVRRLYGSTEQARDTLHFKDGRVFARFTRALAFGDQRGRIWCFKDVTEESRAQAELAASLNLFRAVIDNAPLRIFWKDQDLRFLGCNPIFANDAGLNSEHDLIGKSDAEMIWREHADVYNADDLAVMNSGVTKLAFEEQQTTPDGKMIWLRTSKVPLHNRDHELVGVLGMYEDVTSTKLAASALALSEEKFRKAFVLIPDAMNINRLSDGMYVSVNDGFTKLLGYSSEEIVGHTSLEFDIWQHPEDRARLVEALKQNGSVSSFESCFRDKAGGIHFASMSAAVLDIDSQAHIISISRDMTERKKIEAALDAEQKRFRTILRNASDGITVMNSQACLLEVSDSFCAMLGYSRDELIGMHMSQWDCGSTTVEEKMEIIRSQWQSTTRSLFQTRHRRKDGSTYDAEISGIVIDLNGQKVLFNSTRDITERKQAEAQIHALAFSDPLTGLPNRRLLLDRLEQAMVSGLRHKRQNALLFIDLDDFKTLNDSLGHDLGDQLLKQIAGRVLDCVREGDTVARLGGDEFVILLEDLDERAHEAAMQAEAVARKINHTLRQIYQLTSHSYHCSASIGITLFGGVQREKIEEPLKRAELAMYKAKEDGRDNLRFYESDMSNAINSRATLETDLHKALALAEFLLYYQAQVDRNGQPTGVEALVRWRHPERGIVSPAEFIPVAESSGLILPLGHWVLHTACQQLATWALRPEMAHLTMAVNVSARQFRWPDFVDEVLSVLEATGANPSRLKLELTESLLLENMKDVITKMAALKAIGVKFSLDDFGTGYSSLAYLKRLPLDQLKIDRGFVCDILTDLNDAAIAKMVIALAESMGLNVIAEGVETQAQRDALDGIGCHSFQGYLFARPLPIEEFEAFVQTHFK